MVVEKKTDGSADKALPVARIANQVGRSKMIPLEYPVEYDGKLWDQIEIRRCTGAEIKTYFEQIASGQPFVLPPVVQCPMEVWDVLDADDQYLVDEEARAFMPRRLKAAVKQLSGSGENTSGS